MLPPTYKPLCKSHKPPSRKTTALKVVCVLSFLFGGYMVFGPSIPDSGDERPVKHSAVKIPHTPVFTESKVTPRVPVDDQSSSRLRKDIDALKRQNVWLKREIRRRDEKFDNMALQIRRWSNLHNLHNYQMVEDGARAHELFNDSPMDEAPPSPGTKNRLMISIAVNQPGKYARNLIDNVVRYTDDSTVIVVHVSANGAPFTGPDAEYVARHPRVLINPKRLLVSWCATNILYSHLSNLHYGIGEMQAAGSEPFTHVMLLANNVLLLRCGMERHIFARNVSSSYALTMSAMNTEEDRWDQQTPIAGAALLQGLTMDEFDENMKNPETEFVSNFIHHEGTFYITEIVAKVVNLMIRDSKRHHPVLPQPLSTRIKRQACMEEWVLTTFTNYHYKHLVDGVRKTFGWAQPLVRIYFETKPEGMKKLLEREIKAIQQYGGGQTTNIHGYNLTDPDAFKFNELCPECKECVVKYKNWIVEKYHKGNNNSPTTTTRPLSADAPLFQECMWMLQYWESYFGEYNVFGYKRVPLDVESSGYKALYSMAMNPPWTTRKTFFRSKLQGKSVCTPLDGGQV